MLNMSSTQWAHIYSLYITSVWIRWGVFAHIHVCQCVEARWVFVADVDYLRFSGSEFPVDCLFLQSFISSPPMKISPNLSQHTTTVWNQASLLKVISVQGKNDTKKRDLIETHMSYDMNIIHFRTSNMIWKPGALSSRISWESNPENCCFAADTLPLYYSTMYGLIA